MYQWMDHTNAFLEKVIPTLFAAAGMKNNMEIVATKIWTLPDKLDGKLEFCNILNHAIRTDHPLQIGPATKITCMMQHFLNAERREKCLMQIAGRKAIRLRREKAGARQKIPCIAEEAFLTSTENSSNA